MQGIVSGYYQVSIWICRFVYLNVLWIAFTLLGMIVFGFMPATTAMFAVVRKWVAGEADISIYYTFWKSYKREFVNSNGAGFVLMLIGYLLIMEFRILRSQESIEYFIASYGVVALMIIYGIVLLYFFPIFVHFKLKNFQVVKWSFIIGVVHPILTIFLAVIVCSVLYLLWITVPALVFFVGGSLLAFIISWGTSKAFGKYVRESENVSGVPEL